MCVVEREKSPLKAFSLRREQLKICWFIGSYGMAYERQTSAKATTFAPEFCQFWRRAKKSQILAPGGKPAATKLAAAAMCVSNRVPVNTVIEFV